MSKKSTKSPESEEKRKHSDNENEVLQDIGRIRFVKKKHCQDKNNGIVNEKFIDKVKECKLSSKEIKYLSELQIIPFHEVPPQHEIEHNAGTRILTKKERLKFQQICKIKNGSFSQEEDCIITKNWKKFCKKHNWNRAKTSPFLNMSFGGKSLIPYKKNRKKFVQILARKLPQRTLYSVYHRFRNLYSLHKVNRYTKEEDEKILQHIFNCNEEDEQKKYSILAKLLNRTRMSVYRRIKILRREGILSGNREAEIKLSLKEDLFDEMFEENYDVEKEKEEEAEIDDSFDDEVEEDEKSNFDLIDNAVSSEDEDNKSSKRKLKNKTKHEDCSEEKILS